jgi:hypothetical protein
MPMMVVVVVVGLLLACLARVRSGVSTVAGRQPRAGLTLTWTFGRDNGYDLKLSGQ